MTFNPSYTMGDVLGAASLALVFIGLLLNWWQIRRDGKVKRAEFAMQVVDVYDLTDEAWEIYDKVMEGDSWYTASFPESEESAGLDEMLYFLDTVGNIYNRELIRTEDLGGLAADVILFHRDSGVRAYMSYVKDELTKAGIRFDPFESFCQMAGTLECENKLLSKKGSA
jgi:hypothetical protein